MVARNSVNRAVTTHAEDGQVKLVLGAPIYRNWVTSDDAVMMLHVARCRIAALFRTPIIRSKHEYSVQDTATIFHANPVNSGVTSVNGAIGAENTARSNVVNSSKASAGTPWRPEERGQSQ